MTWFRLDDTFSSHPSARAAGLKGRALWIEGAQHCSQHLTDGVIAKHMLGLLAASAEIGSGEQWARKLVEVGMWVDEGDHWRIPNWSAYQPARADVEAVKERKALAGEKGNHKRWHVDRGVTVPDCRFCHPTAITNGSQSAMTVRSHNDRHDTTRHDTPGYDHHQQPVVAANASAVVDQAIRLIAEHEAEIARGRGVDIDDDDAYRGGIAKRLTAAGTVAELAAQHPDWTPEQLCDRHLEPTPLGSLDELIQPQGATP